MRPENHSSLRKTKDNIWKWFEGIAELQHKWNVVKTVRTSEETLQAIKNDMEADLEFIKQKAHELINSISLEA